MAGFLITAIESYGFSIPANCDFMASMGCTTHEAKIISLAYQCFQPDVSVFTRISDRGLLGPIVNELTSLISYGKSITVWLSERLASSQRVLGYEVSNLTNLVGYSSQTYDDIDFSNLTVWQTKLRKVNVRETLSKNCDRTQTFTDNAQIITLHLWNDPHTESEDEVRSLHLKQVQSWQQLEGLVKTAWMNAIMLSKAAVTSDLSIVVVFSKVTR